MNRLAIALLLALVASPLVLSTPVAIKALKLNGKPAITFVKAAPNVDLCPTCIEFSDQALDELLNIILNAGVIGGCGELCSILAARTGSKALGLVCDLLCDYVGIREFIKFIEEADLDPIYYCELMSMCPIFDHGDAKITAFSVSPKSGPRGTQFLIDIEWLSQNGTGTGELIVEIETVDKIPLESGFLEQAKPAGRYGEKISLEAKPDPHCDPTQEPCEQWLPGTYNMKVAICNGECGSKHPHSQIYDESSTSFTITG